MSISVLNTDAGLSGKTIINLEDAQTVTGLKTYDRDPNPPFAVSANSAVVPNLIAESLSGGTVSATTGTFSSTLAVTGLITGRTVTNATSTSTGAQNNWAPGLGTNGDSCILWAGASDAAITGIAGGVDGQLVTIKNRAGGPIITFANNSGSSSAGNKFINTVTSAPMPVAQDGYITYLYISNAWYVVAYDQGAWITPTFAAGDYTASSGSWTVASGDVFHCKYLLVGKTLTVTLFVATSTVSATPASLIRAVPGGFSATISNQVCVGYAQDNGGAREGMLMFLSGATMLHQLLDGSNWATATDTTVVNETVSFEVT